MSGVVEASSVVIGGVGAGGVVADGEMVFGEDRHNPFHKSP